MQNNVGKQQHFSKGQGTHGELGGPGAGSMEAEHDDLQAVAAVGALEEARVQQVSGQPRGQVDPPVRQAVTRQNITAPFRLI